MRWFIPFAVVAGLAGCGDTATNSKTVSGPLTEEQLKNLQEEERRIEAEERGPVKAPRRR